MSGTEVQVYRFLALMFALGDNEPSRWRRAEAASSALTAAGRTARQFGLDSHWFEHDMAVYRAVLATNERVRQAQAHLNAMVVS